FSPTAHPHDIIVAHQNIRANPARRSFTSDKRYNLMRATSAKKHARSSRPTWSKVGGPKSKAQGPKSRTRNAKRKTQNAKLNRVEIPAHLQRELTALLLLVSAALFGLGLVSWREGGQGIVGYMGGFLAQMFGVAAWLVPAALGLVAFVLFLGARPRN